MLGLGQSYDVCKRPNRSCFDKVSMQWTSQVPAETAGDPVSRQPFELVHQNLLHQFHPGFPPNLSHGGINKVSCYVSSQHQKSVMKGHL